MGRKKDVASRARVAIVGYAQEKGAINYAEQFKVVGGRLVDPQPVSLDVAKRFANLMREQPSVKEFGEFFGEVPWGRSLKFIRKELIIWEVTEDRYPRLLYAPGSKTNKTLYRYGMRGQVFVFNAQNNTLSTYLRVGNKFTIMPLPNINSRGNLCTGSIFDRWACPNNLGEAIPQIEARFHSARFTEYRIQIPVSLDMLVWWKQNAARNPDEKETIQKLKALWRKHKKPFPLYNSIEDAQNSTAMADGTRAH